MVPWQLLLVGGDCNRAAELVLPLQKAAVSGQFSV